MNGRSFVEHDPINAPKVRRIFKLFAYHAHMLDSLVDILARQGVVDTDRQPRFSRSTLHRVLHNRLYVGEVAYRGVSYKGQFEPLVNLATFQRVREKFGSDFVVYHKPQMTFAGGLITCSHCGRIVTGEHKIKKSPDGTRRDYVYYRCWHTPGGAPTGAADGSRSRYSQNRAFEFWKS